MDLAKEVAGEGQTGERVSAEFCSDFGRVAERRPAVVLRPSSAAGVSRAVRFAAERGLQVAARGAGHSQNGLSLSDQVLLDTRGLDRILQVDEERCTATCQSGVTWRALLERLLPLRLSPPVLTNNLDVTLAGTLSTAGLGVASWRRGTQADHCLELEAVTGEGEMVRCSPASEPELFDALRAGLGMFGVITEVKLQLRRHRPRVRTAYLLYDELDALTDDLQRVLREERFDYLESWCTPLPQGFRKAGAERKPFAKWFFPLHATLEVDSNTAGDQLGGLRFYKHVHTEEAQIEEFFTRLDPLFVLWKRGGFWNWAHPWMECILPWEAAPFYVSQALANIPPAALLGGHILLWPARGAASGVPLFVKPPGDYLMGFGILPAVARERLPEVLPSLAQASRAAVAMGGTRYLSGWLAFEPADWKEHYGSSWPAVVRLKRKYDPHGVFNLGWALGDL
ncbi:MAG: FAD-binding oxidoreductase [Terriglobia bacterium]